MAQLSPDLQKLQSLKGALDVVRYLAERSTPADTETICDELDMSDRRFGKAIKRLVTTGYVQMNNDYEYHMTDKGIRAAEEVAEFDAAGGAVDTFGEGKIVRRLLVALPRKLTAGQSTNMHIGFEDDPEKGFDSPADIVVRVSTINAVLSSDSDEMLKLSNSHVTQIVSLTPEMYSQVRVKVQVFQLAPNGEDITMCGGMYVDVDVSTNGDEDGFVAYATQIALDPT